MHDLIKITQIDFNGDRVRTVNARDLHAFLESRQQFSHWIKGRVEQYGFVEEQDFTIDKIIIRKATQIDYHISLDMAKELSMVEKNAKGKQARQYFIECEKIARQPIDWEDPIFLRGLLGNYLERTEIAEAKVLEYRPKVEAYDQLLNADGLYGLQNAARALSARPNLFIRWLKQKFLFYQGKSLVARVEYTQRGLFEIKTTIVDDKVRPTVFITPKGLFYFRNKMPPELLIEPEMRLVQ